MFSVSGLVVFAIVAWLVGSFMAEQLDTTVANELAEVHADAGSQDTQALKRVITGLTVNSPGIYYLLQAPDGQVMASPFVFSSQVDNLTVKLLGGNDDVKIGYNLPFELSGNMVNMMQYANLASLLRAANPFQNFINADKSIGKDIIQNAKYLK